MKAEWKSEEGEFSQVLYTNFNFLNTVLSELYHKIPKFINNLQFCTI